MAPLPGQDTKLRHLSEGARPGEDNLVEGIPWGTRDELALLTDAANREPVFRGRKASLVLHPCPACGKAISSSKRQLTRRLRRKHEKRRMKNPLNVIAPALLLLVSNISLAQEDSRQLVALPQVMQRHMLSNMRDHLAAINEILISMANRNLDQAAEIAESRLGMSSLESHGASHMAKFMPEGMRQAGTSMHRAASRFALKAQEGEVLSAYAVFSEITSACVACHSGYRIR